MITVVSNSFKALFCIALFFLLHNKLEAQAVSPGTERYLRGKVDSLLKELKTAGEDTNKVKILAALAFRMNGLVKPDEALTYSNEALQLSKKLGFKLGEEAAYGHSADAYALQKNYDKALEYDFYLLKIFESDGRHRSAGGRCQKIGEIYYSQHKYQESLEYSLKALDHYKRAGHKDGAAFLNRNIGILYKEQGNHKKALEHFQEAINYWETDFGYFEKIQASGLYSDVGNLHLETGNYKEAERCFTKAVTLANETKTYAALVSSYKNLGNLYYEQGIYTEALKNYFTALRQAENWKYRTYEAGVQNSIANVYSSTGDMEQAINYYFKSLEVYRELDDQSNVVVVSCNMAPIYASQSDYKAAISYALNARDVAEEIMNKQSMMTAYSTLGGVYYSQADAIHTRKGNADSVTGRLAEALQLETKALEIAKVLDIKREIAKIEIGLGSIINMQARLDNGNHLKTKSALAIQHLNNGLSLSKEILAKENIRNAYWQLALAYKQLKDFDRSFNYFTLYTEVKDSLLNTETNKKLEQARIKYEVDKKEAEEKLNAEKKQSDLKFAFTRREDSIKFEKQLAEEQLKQQTLITSQKVQALELKQVSLDLANKENQLNQLNLSKSQLELQAEQSRSEENEKLLVLSEKDKALQANSLLLKESQLRFQQKQIKTQDRERKLLIGGAVLLSILFVSIFVIIRNRQRSKELIAVQKARLEKAQALHKMTELELQSLRAQLNPHFMFNSLNAIQDLIFKEDNENSHIYLSRFSRLLRMLLDNASQSFITLQKELEILELYLTLEKLRIPDLEYSIEMSGDIDPQTTMTPNMMLQPYIENAVWHGLSHKQKDKRIIIRIEKQADNILFHVIDNGVGRQKAMEIKHSTNSMYHSKGMELLSKRFSLLSQQYGEKIEIKVKDLVKENSPAGTEVQISLPVSLYQQINTKYNDSYAYN